MKLLEISFEGSTDKTVLRSSTLEGNDSALRRGQKDQA